MSPTERRNAFWAPFVEPGNIYTADPDDGHPHTFQAISPRSLGTFGPTGVCCTACGWFKAWGKP